MVAMTTNRKDDDSDAHARGEGSRGEGSGGGGAAREGSVDSLDSEGFLLREREDDDDDEALDDGDDDDAGAAGRKHWAQLINLHHDHNRDARRTCTVFVYLTDVVGPEEVQARPPGLKAHPI